MLNNNSSFKLQKNLLNSKSTQKLVFAPRQQSGYCQSRNDSNKRPFTTSQFQLKIPKIDNNSHSKDTYTSRQELEKQSAQTKQKSLFNDIKTNASTKHINSQSKFKGRNQSNSQFSVLENNQSKKETNSLFSSMQGFRKKQFTEGANLQVQFYPQKKKNLEVEDLQQIDQQANSTQSSQFKLRKQPSLLTRQSSNIRERDSPSQMSEASKNSSSIRGLQKKNRKKGSQFNLIGKQNQQKTYIVEVTENFKDMIKSSSQNFFNHNKALIKEKKIQQQDLETLLIHKEQQSELDMVKRDYYDMIEENRKRALRSFRLRSKVECLLSVKELINIGLHAFDIELLKKVYNLKALINIFFDDYDEAIKDFKQLRIVADEEEDMYEKMQAYENLGRCYQHLKQYENAIKCHKKQLELAWKIGDTANELRSYEAMGVQYYYIGELEKSKFYNDRFMRGKCEKKNSQIRKIYEVRSQERQMREQVDRLPFKKVKQILKSFDSISNLVSRVIQKKIFSNTYGTGKLQEEIDFFRNGIDQREDGIILRRGSPISEISVNDLPSPRIVIENNKMKNACLLPHYDKHDNSALSKKQKNFLKVAKNKGQTDKLQDLKNEAEIELKNFNRGKIKDNTTLDNFRRQREESRNIKGTVDMQEVLRKAKLLGQKQKGSIQINHLSPNRNLRHFKEQEDIKHSKAHSNFDTLENEIKEKIMNTENDAVIVSNITEEHLNKIISQHEKQRMPGRKLLDFQRKTSFLKNSNPFSFFQSGNTVNRTIESSQNTRSANEIQVLAQIRYPGVYKIKKFADGINGYIKQNMQNFQNIANKDQEVLQIPHHGIPKQGSEKMYSKVKNYISKNIIKDSRRSTISPSNSQSPKNGNI